METVTVERTKTHLIIKIPFTSAEAGAYPIKAPLKSKLDTEIDGGLSDIAAGRIFGPFDSVAQFKKALKNAPIGTECLIFLHPEASRQGQRHF